MKKKILLILFVLPLLSFTVHKFYVSVTNINYSEDSKAFQMTTRIFIDDLEALLEERYGIDAGLATSEELEIANDYIEKYLKAKLVVQLNNEESTYKFLGKKYDNDVAICYLEIENVALDTLRSIEIENEILTDLYEEQKNLVHIKYKDKKKSFILVRSDTKGMLNL
ncbi:DUF6702 family protein [uncultured Croceitalea sp.]|uniref:DUF6702 family protein n=1 Tax=uncultured Croceitalea sp. TaxID=1798908 RepID=UPI0033062758